MAAAPPAIDPVDAAYIALHQGMHDYLRDTLDVANQQLRLNIMRGGFSNTDDLRNKREKFTHDVVMRIVKRGGNLEERDFTAEMEDDLRAFFIWCSYSHLTQRNLDLATATRPTIEAVSLWYNQLPEDPDTTTVAKFKDGCDKRVWFESIRHYLGVKKGNSGMPIPVSYTHLTLPTIYSV